MQNAPIFTARNPELSRWQSFVEQNLKKDHPEFSLGAIRALPTSQGCWEHVRKTMDGETISPPTGGFDSDNIQHQAYASYYFFEAVKKLIADRNTVNFSSSVDTWPYSTAEWVEWLATSAGSYYAHLYDYFTGNFMYRDYKDDGNGNIDYSVIDWVLPSDAKIALIGDWGTGNEDAHYFLRDLISQGVDCIIHLGDVYYTGTEDECRDNFLNIIRHEIGSNVPVFTIPGNHEYYSYGNGFYYLIDNINNNIPISNARQAASYFCLRTADNSYQFLGVDTGYNDHSPWDTNFTPPAPKLKSSNDYYWANYHIKNFSGKTIMLSHHQLFSHSGTMNSEQYGASYANPHLYKHFSPFFHNKIAAWYWGHEHSFALFKDGAFGLNQGRLVGSSSYEEAISDNPYADTYPMVPYSPDNRFLATNSSYSNDKSADSYYPHVGAIITLRTNNNPLIDYYSYPSWKDGHAPSNLQLTHIHQEMITNPTKSPTGSWIGNHHISNNDIQSDKAPALVCVDDQLYMVYKNTHDNDHLWWDAPTYDTHSGHFTATNPSKIMGTTHTSNTDNDNPDTASHPALAYYNGMLYLVYRGDGTRDLRWCTYNFSTKTWTKRGKIQDTEVSGSTMSSKHGPSLTVFNNKLYLFYLDDDTSTVKYATCQNTTWDLQGSIYPSGSSSHVDSHHDVVPAAVGTSDNLFLIYAPDSSSDNYNLGVLRLNKSNVWNDMEGGVFEGTNCFPLDPEPDEVGEPCTAEGGIGTGIDSCVMVQADYNTYQSSR